MKSQDASRRRTYQLGPAAEYPRKKSFNHPASQFLPRGEVESSSGRDQFYERIKCRTCRRPWRSSTTTLKCVHRLRLCWMRLDIEPKPMIEPRRFSLAPRPARTTAVSFISISVT